MLERMFGMKIEDLNSKSFADLIADTQKSLEEIKNKKADSLCLATVMYNGKSATKKMTKLQRIEELEEKVDWLKRELETARKANNTSVEADEINGKNVGDTFALILEKLGYKLGKEDYIGTMPATMFSPEKKEVRSKLILVPIKKEKATKKNANAKKKA